jgi:hypothetical protein
MRATAFPIALLCRERKEGDFQVEIATLDGTDEYDSRVFEDESEAMETYRWLVQVMHRGTSYDYLRINLLDF